MITSQNSGSLNVEDEHVLTQGNLNAEWLNNTQKTAVEF